jgi:hypothetical protein
VSLVPPPYRNSSGDAPTSDRSLGLITIYANGFMVGNGEFRDIKDPKNKAFIEAMKSG